MMTIVAYNLVGNLIWEMDEVAKELSITQALRILQ